MLNMTFMRNYSRYGSVNTFHESLSTFLDSRIESGVNSIFYGDHFLDIDVKHNHSDTTLIMFHAAVDVDNSTLPVFVGRQIVEGINANTVYVSDSSLDLRAPIGWFAGDESRHLQSDLAKVIAHIHEQLAESRNLIFFGSSAGGFAALYFSNLFSGSLAVVCNPQTHIGKYHNSAVQRYLDQCWSGQKLSNCNIEYDLPRAYNKSMKNHVLYLQNADDSLHIDEHLKPWLEATETFSDKRRVLIGNWGKDHAPVPPFILTGILGQAAYVDGDWPALLNDAELEDFACRDLG